MKDKTRYEWVLPVIKQLSDEFNKHGKGFIVIPFSHSLEEAEKNKKNGEVPMMITDLDDPTAFMGAITFAIHTYCRQFKLDFNKMAHQIAEATDEIRDRHHNETGSTHIINKETSKEVDNETVYTVDADAVLHPERYNKKTEAGRSWKQFNEWEKNLVKYVENKCAENDASYSLVVNTLEGEDHKDHAYSTAGNMKQMDLLAAVASLLSNLVKRENGGMNLDDCVFLAKELAKTMMGHEENENE